MGGGVGLLLVIFAVESDAELEFAVESWAVTSQLLAVLVGTKATALILSNCLEGTGGGNLPDEFECVLSLGPLIVCRVLASVDNVAWTELVSDGGCSFTLLGIGGGWPFGLAAGWTSAWIEFELDDAGEPEGGSEGLVGPAALITATNR